MDDDRAIQNYIFYQNIHWDPDGGMSMRAALGEFNIVQAYQQAASKLESNILAGTGLERVPDNFAKNVTQVLTMRKKKKELKNSNDVEKLFDEITRFISTTLNKTILYGTTTVGRVGGGLGQAPKNMDEISAMVSSLRKISDAIAQYDVDLQKVSTSNVSIFSAESMSKTLAAYKILQDTINKYGSMDNFENGFDNVWTDLKKVCGSLVGDLKGGLEEWAGLIHSQVLQQVQQKVNEAVIEIQSASASGTKSTFIPSKEKQERLGQSKFVSKSDNIIGLDYQENSINFYLNLGISEKSYIESKGKTKSLADGISWQATMAEADLLNELFEFYYANLLVHEPGNLTGYDEASAYLAAKAAAFIISGVSGGDQTQAYFIRYADKVEYIPDLLRKIGTSNKIFAIKPTKKSINIKQEFVQTPADEITDAFIRTRNMIAKIRQSIKFNATRS